MLTKIKNTVFALVAGLSVATTVYAQQTQPTISFSARATQTQQGQETEIGMIYKSGTNMRLEFVQNGQPVIQILRPSAGVALNLDMQNQTYTEFNGPPEPPESDYSTPCPGQGVPCERNGADEISGVQAERWLVTYPNQQSPTIILWDPWRRHALRQEFPDGSQMSMTFVAMEEVSGRSVEHWSVQYTAQGQQPRAGGWWYDSSLRLVVKEVLADGTMRLIENISVGPLDPALFEAPAGWQKLDPPEAALTE